MHHLEPQGSHVRFRPFSAGSGLPNVRGPGSCAYGHPDTNTDRDGVADPNTYIVNAYCNTNVDANSLANPDGYRNTAVLCRPIRDNADRRQYRAGHDGHRKSLE
jgi:hypothetical protein